MRLFVAAYPPADVCDHLERRLQDLHVAVAAGRGVNTRLARRDTWHVTLVFLGEVAEPRTADVHEAIERAVGGWRAAGSGAPELRLAGGGRLGRGRFTLLWVGVDGEREALGRLARAVRRELKRDRLPYDNRPFKPHVTVARPGDRLERAGVAGADGGAGTQPPRSQAVVRAPGRVAAGTRPATVTERRQTGKA